MDYQKIVLASANQGKVNELQKILANYQITVVPQSEYNVPDIEETGLTFIENAILKARNCSEHTGLPALADDSGLVVNALNGAPGIYSARYAGEAKNDSANNQKLLDNLQAEYNRQAQFVCVLAFVRQADDPLPIISQGLWEGEILTQPQGNSGFGYDPLFFVPETNCSAAELEPAIKNKISHRAKAFAQFIEKFKQCCLI